MKLSNSDAADARNTIMLNLFMTWKWWTLTFVGTNDITCVDRDVGKFIGFLGSTFVKFPSKNT